VKLSPSLGPILLGALVLLGAAVYLRSQGLDRAGVVGLAIGGGLGGVNLVLGWWTTTRALKRSPAGALRVVVGGFALRLLALVALVLFFQGQDWIDVTAFALAFLACFVVFLAVEVHLVQKSLDRPREAA